MPDARQPEVWIGLVEIRALPDCEILISSSGAFVYVLTTAVNCEMFQNRAEELMAALHVQIVGLSEIEPVREKRQRNGLSDELQAISKEVQSNPAFIRYSTFHTWSDPPN
jgi:hypothetical protein